MYIFYYHTVTDELRSVYDALIWQCRIQDLPVLMFLGAGHKNKVRNTILHIIRFLLTFIGLRIFCLLCHRNFSFALQMSVILGWCRPKKQRERSLLIPSLRPFILTFSFSIQVLETGSGTRYKGEILERSLSYLEKYKFQAFACLTENCFARG